MVYTRQSTPGTESDNRSNIEEWDVVESTSEDENMNIHGESGSSAANEGMRDNVYESLNTHGPDENRLEMTTDTDETGSVDSEMVYTLDGRSEETVDPGCYERSDTRKHLGKSKDVENVISVAKILVLSLFLMGSLAKIYQYTQKMFLDCPEMYSVYQEQLDDCVISGPDSNICLMTYLTKVQKYETVCNWDMEKILATQKRHIRTLKAQKMLWVTVNGVRNSVYSFFDGIVMPSLKKVALGSKVAYEGISEETRKHVNKDNFDKFKESSGKFTDSISEQLRETAGAIASAFNQAVDGSQPYLEKGVECTKTYVDKGTEYASFGINTGAKYAKAGLQQGLKHADVFYQTATKYSADAVEKAASVTLAKLEVSAKLAKQGVDVVGDGLKEGAKRVSDCWNDMFKFGEADTAQAAEWEDNP